MNVKLKKKDEIVWTITTFKNIKLKFGNIEQLGRTRNIKVGIFQIKIDKN